jgi:hypothetical protein
MSQIVDMVAKAMFSDVEDMIHESNQARAYSCCNT